ncbi:MAG: carbon-nitrogen hydrolase family protein [Candidatus Thermoplasmatota archaeon]|nr:carbon-nitrogen hydrolase family protein [Candidatus Thermoplasmatota archaeon]
MRNVRILGIETSIFELNDAFSFMLDLENTVEKNKYDLILLPERWINHVFENDSDELDNFKDISKGVSGSLSAVFIPGSISIRRGGRLYNSSPVFHHGKILGWQDKMVPFGFEKGLYSPGNEIKCFSAKGISFGIEICYDLNFPFIAKIHARKGAELILNPSLIRKEGIGMWHIYTKARSLENRVPIVSLNSSYEIFSGGSIATFLEKKRWGVLIHSMRPRNGRLDVTINIDTMRNSRDIRLQEDPGVYGINDTTEKEGKVR